MQAFAIDHFGTLDDLGLRELPDPVPASGEVLVRVRGAALNPADWKVLTGKNGGRFLHASRFPLVLGYDFSGVVEGLGQGTQGLAPGDEVFGFVPYSRKNRQGTFGEYVAVPADSVAQKAAATSHVEAACSATAASTALQSLRDKGGLRAGQTVLVNGASGGVGGYAVQIAKNAGATVWGTCSASKMAAVEALGADRVIDYRATPISALEQPFDLIFDAASTSSLGACRRILRRGGAYVTLLPSLSFLTGWLRGRLTGRACRIIVVQSRRDDLALLADWMAAGQLRHAIDTTYPLRELAEAMRHFQSGNPAGKIGIRLDDGDY